MRHWSRRPPGICCGSATSVERRDELHIHPNTLRYRVRRAEELLGMSLDDPDNRLLLEIQLLVQRWST